MRRTVLFVLLGLLAASGCSAPDGVDADEATQITVVPPADGSNDGGTSQSDTDQSDTDQSDTDQSDDDAGVRGDLAWERCERPSLVVETQCATLSVPLDYDDPDGRRLDIAVARADTADGDDQIGSLVVNPGGPGGSGVDFVEQAAAILPAEVQARFDIVGFDPRGVGASTAVECDIDIDDNIALVPEGDDDAFDRLVDDTLAELTTCTADTLEIAPLLGTNNAARDLDRLRAALGDDGLTYVGYSYGTRLGATYAELFPDHVRALVLDAGVKPTTDAIELDLGQAEGFDRALLNFAEACDSDPDCLVSDVGPTLEVLADLRSEIREVGSFDTDDPDRVLTPGELDLGVIAALYSKDTWPFLAQGMFLAESQQDGTLLQVLGDALVGRQPDGTYDNSNIANAFIDCADDANRPDVDEVRADANRAAARSEHFDALLRASTGCLGIPESADPLVLGPAATAPPILVLGNTGDPATPYEWSVELAEFLDSAVLYSVEAEGHTAYGTIECVTDVVDAYLIDLVVPEAGDSCSDNRTADFFVPIDDTPVGLLVSLFECLRDNGLDVPSISAADVLADPSGEILGQELDPADPAFAEAAFACSDILFRLQGEL